MPRRTHAPLGEFGLDPSDELQALELAVLRHELLRPIAPADGHNLPAPMASFVGRENELDADHSGFSALV